MVQGVVTQNHGHVCVESTVGAGAVAIYLPATRETVAGRTLPIAERRPAVARNGALMGDDSCRGSSAMSEAAGIPAAAAHDESDALRLASGEHAPIDLLITAGETRPPSSIRCGAISRAPVYWTCRWQAADGRTPRAPVTGALGQDRRHGAG